MHAIVIERPGDPEVLRWTEVEDPKPGQGEVLIDVVASAVNRADVLQRQGNYPVPPGASPYPGLECSGRISQLGPDVTGWNVGDEVCALLAGGGYAERVAVPTGQLLPVPAGVSLTDAASLPEVTCTVQSNLFTLARLDPDETLLVHGGSSGIGTMAIQLARHLGTRVFCTAGTSDKLRRCRELGAAVGINYREEDFVDRVRDETDGRGVDVILDMIGAAYLSRNVNALATGGRLVIIGLQGGRAAELDLSRVMAKRAVITGSTLRPRSSAEKAAIVSAVREQVWPAIAVGAVRPVIHSVLPLRDAAEGHRILESSEHIGKVILAADT
jgi:putative PIG3 family NAD(P)H quinone oxidoreductase